MTKYGYCIQYGKPKFFKNGEHMTESEILNEMEVKEILLKQWIDEANRLSDENEQLKKELSDIDGQLLMLDNCDNWDYDRMKHTVREIAEIIGYNGTINPKRG